MFAFVPIGAKLLVPGYRLGILRRHAALIDAINALFCDWRLGDEGGMPWIESKADKVRLYSFPTEPANLELYRIVAPALPVQLLPEHFRIAKDFVTRWHWPHMRPDLTPQAYAPEQMEGLHGQHKDSIASIVNLEVRDRLRCLFVPSSDDVVIDCGAFVGCGSIRMSRDAVHGRVLAVEASGACHDLLVRNVNANQAANVTPLHLGIWRGRSRIALEKTYAQGNSLVSEVQRGSTQERIETISIDELVAEYGLTRVDMISLTLNGAEIEAVQGADRTLRSFRPRVRAAGWYMRDGTNIASTLKPQLERHDYHVFVGPRKNVLAVPRERL